MLDNITRDYERDSARDQLLQGLTEGSRASLGNLQAAVEVLDDPDLDAAARERFLAVVRDEAAAMARRIQELAARSTQDVKTRWPLEDMLGADLVAAALRRIEAVCRVAHRHAGGGRRAVAEGRQLCAAAGTEPTWPAGWSTSSRSAL